MFTLKSILTQHVSQGAHKFGPPLKKAVKLLSYDLRRKTREDEVREDELALLEKRPRSTGSLVQNPHDDITTRIKNVEYIEMGKYRLKAS